MTVFEHQTQTSTLTKCISGGRVMFLSLVISGCLVVIFGAWRGKFECVGLGLRRKNIKVSVCCVLYVIHCSFWRHSSVVFINYLPEIIDLLKVPSIPLLLLLTLHSSSRSFFSLSPLSPFPIILPKIRRRRTRIPLLPNFPKVQRKRTFSNYCPSGTGAESKPHSRGPSSSSLVPRPPTSPPTCCRNAQNGTAESPRPTGSLPSV